MSGSRVAVKDLFAVAGHAIGAGNPTWLAGAPVQATHAPAVQALLNAGADITGIAHTDELAYGSLGLNAHYGMPPNPVSPGRVPGGSSSGSASAVALGLADIGLGTDAAGSVRVPASYCGLYSMRPTHGMVPNTGRVSLAPSFDTIGWMTRTPGLLKRVSDVLLPSRPARPVDQLVLAADLFDLADPSLRPRLLESAHAWADSLAVPVRVRENTCASRLDAWAEALGVVQAVEMWQVHGVWVEEHYESVSPSVAETILAGGSMPVEYLAWARDVMSQARLALTELLPPGTALLQPAAPTAAPEPTGNGIALRTATVLLSCAASTAGLPALTLPGLRGPDGAIGLGLVTAAGGDRALTALLTDQDTCQDTVWPIGPAPSA
ncbi:amidase [Streptomyces paludis]|uniref:Amidase n=1 Tax=Streptomyces paludis TaxID=2282738 RepID=A0A345I2C4_9ACTN|nr:amidase [Streptomyces paludis]